MKPLTAFHHWQTAQAQLETALDTFLDACATLQLTCSEASIEAEGVVERLCNRLDQLTQMGRKMVASRLITLQIRNSSAAVVPIAKLPPELLIKVFAYCADPCSRGRELYGQLYLYPIDTITRVCSRWRRIALSTPSLWSLVIVDYDPTHRHTSHIPTRTRLWLDRSASIPLDLHFRSTPSGRDIQQIMAVLQPNLPRIARLAFHAVGNNFINDLLLAQGEISCPALSALSLSDNQRDLAVFENPGRPIWPIVRDLQELELVDLGLDTCPQPKELAMVLARCPNLQNLRIRLDNSFYFSALANQPDIYLPALRQLEIGPLDSVRLRGLLPILRPSHPKLHVALELPSCDDNETVLQVKRFLQRSLIAVLKLQSSWEDLSLDFENDPSGPFHRHTTTLDFSEDEITFDAHLTSNKLPELQVSNISGRCTVGSLDSQSLDSQ